MEEQIVSVRVSEDPLAALPVGATIQFRPIPDVPSGSFSSVSQSVNNWGFFRGAILSLIFKTAGGADMDGSAVMVAPGLIFSATHVLEPHLESLLRGDTQIYCVGISEKDAQLWIVRAFTPAGQPNDDIVFLHVEACSDLPAESAYHIVPCEFSPPRLGEQLTIVGFRPAAVPDIDQFNYLGHLYVSSGPVTEVYLSGRPGLQYPVAEVGCGTLGGMSGGAVLNESGHLVGLLSTCLMLEDGMGPSYVALLSPLGERPVSPSWPPGFYRTPATLPEIVERVFGAGKPASS